MAVTDLGSMTLGAAVPAGAALGAAVELTVGIAAPDVEAQLDLAANFSASVNLDLAAQIDIATAIIAQLQASISAGLTPPSLSAQADIAADISADLSVKLGLLNAQLTLALDLLGLLGEAGVRVLTFSGAQNNLGSEIASELGSDSSSANAIILLTQSSAAWTAMEGVFKTS